MDFIPFFVEQTYLKDCAGLKTEQRTCTGMEWGFGEEMV
jgi:hypothetical protein